MSRTFEEIYQIVEESSHETAFNKQEAFALYSLLYNLPDHAKIVEIGVEYGRSTSVIAEVSKEKKFEFLAVDNYCEDKGEEAKNHVLNQMKKHNWNFDLYLADSLQALKENKVEDGEIDLIHIDGDHTFDGVYRDTEAWLPKIRKGGFACFDDYSHPTLPEVKKAVDKYMRRYGKQWQKIGIFGNKLGVFKRR